MMNPNISIATENISQSIPQTNFSLDPDSQSYPDPDPERKYAYKVKFYIIRDDNKERTDFVGEEIVMNVIRDLNLNYKDSNILFKYGGFEYIDDSNLIGNLSVPDLYSAFGNLLENVDAFNLIILDGAILNGIDENGNELTTPGFGPWYSTISFYSFRGITSKRVPSHEIGHNFNLRHVSNSSENVVRDPDELGYNAQYGGDKVHDTPAYLSWSNNQFNSSGVYVGSDIDNNGALEENDIRRRYNSQSPKINNLMFVHQGEDLPISYEFTPGQIKRMRHFILEDETTSTYDFIGASVPLKELYQPFETTYVRGDEVTSVDDNGDGTAKVCRNVVQRDRFQKGFDMVYQNQDGTIFATSAPNDLKIIDRTYTYDTKVFQVDNEQKEEVFVDCLRQNICDDEPYVSGEVISTQILGSMNLTIKQLNEIQVKDPKLFDDLMSQYYHILKKVTSSGVVDEKVIYKP